MHFRHILDGVPLTIVTGADVTHGESLINLLTSLREHEPDADVHIWDLGLDESQIATIHRLYPKYQIRELDFDAYPDYMDIRMQAGQYAWKPVIISETAIGKNGIILWLDAGDVITGRLKWIRTLSNYLGFYSPYSSGRIADWTHHGTLNYLNCHGEAILDHNLNGSIVSFDLRNPIAKNLLEKWTTCALNRDCIAPIGSNRSNHRQDQAALSVLSYQSGLVKNGFFMRLASPLNILIHQDV